MAEVQKRAGIDRQQGAMLLQAFERVLVREAIDLNTVHLEGLGDFIATKHPEYIQENAETGEVVMYPPRYSYRFQSEVKLQ